jgi:hypothetical protein
MLSERELIGLSQCGSPPTPCQLTSACISRIFQEYITYKPKEMDYKTFLDLVLALENISNPQSLVYFWRILDMEKTGRLTKQAIDYFYKDVFRCLRLLSYEAPPVANITIEIYDILGCEDSRGPTFQEFINSGQAHTVITMLIDVHGFWAYDNRENLLQAQQDAEDGSDQEFERELDVTQPHAMHMKNDSSISSLVTQNPVENEKVSGETTTEQKIVENPEILYDDDFFT